GVDPKAVWRALCDEFDVPAPAPIDRAAARANGSGD
ncbi:DUF3046 domain-containing protein, partial [Prescottella equi]